MSNQSLQPFFIFGSPRSGTSLLSRMLDSHEHLVVPNESLIFKMFSSSLENYGDLTNIENQKELLHDILETRVIHYWSPEPLFNDIFPLITKPGFAGVIEALICSRAPEKSLLAWGEKSPGHVFYWNEIKQAFPRAKAVHIIRDGRDVASSIINARMGPKTYFAAAKMWCDYLDGIEKIKQDCSADDFVEIYYEELLSSPRETLEKICNMLCIEYSKSMLEFYKKDTKYHTDTTNSTNLNKPLLASNKNKWLKNLTIEDLQEFETIASVHLRRYGFKLGNRIGPMSNIKLRVIRHIISPLNRFISRAKDTQGQKEFLNLKRVQFKRRFKRLFSTQ